MNENLNIHDYIKQLPDPKLGYMITKLCTGSELTQEELGYYTACAKKDPHQIVGMSIAINHFLESMIKAKELTQEKGPTR